MKAPSELEFGCYEDLPLGTLVATHNGKIIFANKIICDLLGYTSETLQQRDLTTLLKKDTTSFSSALNKLVAGAKTVTTEGVIVGKNNDRISVTLSLSKMRKVSDAVVVQIVQKQEVPLLQDSVMFDAIINSLPDATYFKNRDSQFIKVNASYLKKFSLTSDETVINRTDFDLFSIEHAQQAYEDEQKIIKTGKPLLNIEEKETYDDGTVTWVSTSKMPLFDTSGQIIGTFGISRDITEHKRADTEIRLKTSILNAITSRMPVVIYRVNASFEVNSLFGSKELIESFEHSKIVRLKVKDGLSHIIGKLSHSDTDGYISFSSTNQEKEETVYFENYVFEREGEQGEFLGLALDVTDQKNNQFKLKRDAKKLERINRELNEFAYIVSHDLKAPLRAIVNLSDWIEEDLSGTLDDDVQKNLELMKGRVHRMENLINGILQYSRVTKGARINEQVEVGGLLTETIGALDIPERFTIKKTDNMPVVTYSKMDLDRIFTNLISNVVKYHDKERGVIEISWHEQEDHYVFSVADDGPGIDPAYHEKIFKIFQTLHSRDSVESTGIGLTIVKKIVEERGGVISVESEVGQGTKFIFTIPKFSDNELNPSVEP